MDRGRFITVEGIEGVGKSSNIDVAVAALEAAGLDVLTTREPGGTPTAEAIRELLVATDGDVLPDSAELLLMFAARAVNVDAVIRPALAAGQWVVCDRFTDSTRAYQGGGRGMPRERIDWLADWIHGDLRPDLTILLDAPVEVGLARMAKRGRPDRFEREAREFFERVRDSYLGLADAEPDRFVVVDTTQPLAIVNDEVAGIVRRFHASVS